MNPINSILVIYQTRADRYGNRQYGFRYIRCRDSKTFEGKIGCLISTSNITSAFHSIWDNNGKFVEWRKDYFYTIREVTQKEFKYELKDAEYIGSDPYTIYKQALESFGDGNII